MNNYELAKIDYSNGMSTKEIAEKYNVSVATVRKWKSRHNWDSVTKKRDKNVTNKKAKEVAKILIQEGASISEVAKQTQTPRGTIGYWSAKENLQKSQLEHLKEFRDKLRQRVMENKLKRLTYNEEALDSVEDDIRNGLISKATFEKLKLSEEIEQLIFESDRIEKLERLEIEKAKVAREKEQKDKTGSFLDKLKEFI